MAKLIATLSRWVIQKLVILIAILAVLLMGEWLRMEWIRLTQDKEAIAKKEEILAGLNKAQTTLDAEMAPRLVEWGRIRQSKIEAAEAELQKLDAEIREKGEEWSKKLEDFSDLEKVVLAAKRSLDSAKEKRDRLAQEVGWWQRGGYFLSKENRRKVDEYEVAKAEVFARDEAYKTAVAARDALGKIIESSPVKALQDRRRIKEADLAAAKLIRRLFEPAGYLNRQVAFRHWGGASRLRNSGWKPL